MAEDRPLFEELLDVALYAPLGVAMRVLEELPGLAEKGRARIGGQVGTARVIGRFAVTTARRQAESVIGRTVGRPGGTKAATERTEARSEHVAAPDEASGEARGGRGAARPARVRREGRPAGGSRPGGSARPASGDGLAIPGYDALAASQVVPRLEGLSREELDAVRRHEEATRRRRTILGRIAQLEEELDGHAG